MATRPNSGVAVAIRSIDHLKKTAELTLTARGSDPAAVAAAATAVQSALGDVSFDQGGCVFTLSGVVLASCPWEIDTRASGHGVLALHAVATATYGGLVVSRWEPRKAPDKRTKRNTSTGNIAGTGGTATQDLGELGGYATLTIRDPKLEAGQALSIGKSVIVGPLPESTDRIFIDPLAGTAQAYANAESSKRTSLAVAGRPLSDMVVDSGTATVALTLTGGATSTSTFVQWVQFTN